MKLVFTVFLCMIPTLVFAGHRNMAVGSPIVVKVVGMNQQWDAEEIQMSVDNEMVTGLKSGKNRLYLFDEQRDTLIDYLRLANGWQSTGRKPALSPQEIFQVCEGRDSRGAFGMMKCDDGNPYVVLILSDKTMKLHAGMKLYLTRRAVQEMILKLDSVPSIYAELELRIQALESERSGSYGKSSGRHFDSTSRRG